MTSVLNDATTFAAQALRGFAKVHADLVTLVPGGVVRADRPEPPTVAVVTGGGSGHYPAFAGWVGPGLADAAACGDVFASPSAAQICAVARAADNGAGVLLAYGNYAGDVLNFTAAERALRAEGVEVVNLPITDDVASAPPAERARRRGTAGDLVVLKVAGAAAARGAPLAEVAALARRANERTASLGVAFRGCTLPGADAALFSLPPGTMGLGMGVHGEPGIEEVPVPPAAELADLLVTRLLAERPAGAGRALALLNGLGSTGYEELFVLWDEVSDRLAAAGVTVVDPEVDELITSLDMAGLSLTLCWLDEDLASAWRAPCRSAAYVRAGATATGVRRTVTAPTTVPDAARPAVPASSAQAVAAAARAERVLAALTTAEDDLGRLDSVAGDGDHGRGMVRGARAAAEAARVAAELGAGLGATVTSAGEAWAAASGGTSGALWGEGIAAAGRALPDDRAARVADLLAATTAAATAVRATGGAEVGDKTMVDALVPFLEALTERWADPLADADPVVGWRAAAEAAEDAARGTAALVARRGRARPLGERSLGHPDPGAVSLALVLRTLGERR